MRALTPAVVICVAAFFVVAQNQKKREAPPGALEKITAALPDKAFAKPQKPRRLLVFCKTNGFHHASIATGKIAMAELGKKTGAFEAVISDDLENFEVDQLVKFDAICFLNTTQNVFAPHKDELASMSEEDKNTAKVREMRLKENFMKFIKSGRGFVGIHAATDTFHEWEEYGVMINGFFDGHPWTSDTMVSIKVEPGQEKHPLVAMFGGKNIEFKEEIYQLKKPYDSKAVDMLLRLDTEKTDMTKDSIKRKDGDFGIAWARNWGKGRVFYCSIGHNHEMFWNPQILSHYLAGIQWALGDYKVDVKN